MRAWELGRQWRAVFMKREWKSKDEGVLRRVGQFLGYLLEKDSIAL